MDRWCSCFVFFNEIDFLYADDTVTIAENEVDLQNILNKVRSESEKKCLQINIKKWVYVDIKEKWRDGDKCWKKIWEEGTL